MKKRKIKLSLFCFFCLMLMLAALSCKTKPNDEETAQLYKEQITNKTDNSTEMVSEESDKQVETDNAEASEQKEDKSEIKDSKPLQNENIEADDKHPEQQPLSVYGEGIIEHINISKVAKLEFICPGESLSKVTLETVKTITSEDEIKDIFGELSKIAYTEKEKLFDDGDYRIAEPTAYGLRLYDSGDEYICSLELKQILSDENTVIADNYRYKLADSIKIDALIEENIRSNCDCFICTTDELISALDCELCSAAKAEKFCTCKK